MSDLEPGRSDQLRKSPDDKPTREPIDQSKPDGNEPPPSSHRARECRFFATFTEGSDAWTDRVDRTNERTRTHTRSTRGPKEIGCCAGTVAKTTALTSGRQVIVRFIPRLTS